MFWRFGHTSKSQVNYYPDAAELNSSGQSAVKIARVCVPYASSQHRTERQPIPECNCYLSLLKFFEAAHDVMCVGCQLYCLSAYLSCLSTKKKTFILQRRLNTEYIVDGATLAIFASDARYSGAQEEDSSLLSRIFFFCLQYAESCECLWKTTRVQ